MTCPLSVLHTAQCWDFIYTHWSFSKRAVTGSDFVHNETGVVHCGIICVCVYATDKRWSFPKINCLITPLNIQQHRHFKKLVWWYTGRVLWCLQHCASLSLIKHYGTVKTVIADVNNVSLLMVTSHSHHLDVWEEEFPCCANYETGWHSRAFIHVQIGISEQSETARLRLHLCGTPFQLICVCLLGSVIRYGCWRTGAESQKCCLLV